jgi:hypothetical protein
MADAASVWQLRAFAFHEHLEWAIHGIENARPGSEEFLHGMVQFGSGCLRRLSHVHACSKESIPKFMKTTSVPVIDIPLACHVHGPQGRDWSQENKLIVHVASLLAAEAPSKRWT